MTTTEIILILLGVIQFFCAGIGSWVLLQIVAHGNKLATLEAEKDSLVKSMDLLNVSMGRIEEKLNAVLGHHRHTD